AARNEARSRAPWPFHSSDRSSSPTNRSLSPRAALSRTWASSARARIEHMYASSPFRGQRDPQRPAAQVDHRDERGRRAVAVTAALDEADPAVHTFDDRIRKTELDGSDDALEVALDGVGQHAERPQPAAPCARDPSLEIGASIARLDDPIEIAECLLQIPRSEDAMSQATQSCDHGLLTVGEPLRCRAQRRAHTTPLRSRKPELTCRRLVDGIEGFVGERDHVEGIQALTSVGRADPRSEPEGATEVERDGFELGAALWSELVEEREQRIAALALGAPHHTAGVVVDDEGDVVVPASIRDFVDADAIEIFEPLCVEMVGDDAGHDGIDAFPGTTQQPRDRRLVRSLREPRHHVFEV